MARRNCSPKGFVTVGFTVTYRPEVADINVPVGKMGRNDSR